MSVSPSLCKLRKKRGYLHLCIMTVPYTIKNKTVDCKCKCNSILFEFEKKKCFEL